jgi:initiation factor 1A
MVKNTGGNKSKKMASKSFNIPNKNTRFSSNSDEVYAVVNKMMGGNICEVLCIDGITRTCIIRRKFSGKGRRDNWLSKGKWILVGLREWETQNKEKNKCDLLEVYSDYDKEKLIKSSKDTFEIFVSLVNNIENIDNDQLEFSNNINHDVFNNNLDSTSDTIFGVDSNAKSDANSDADANSDTDTDTDANTNSDTDNKSNTEWLDLNCSELDANKKINSIINQAEWINIDDI